MNETPHDPQAAASSTFDFQKLRPVERTPIGVSAFGFYDIGQHVLSVAELLDAHNFDDARLRAFESAMIGTPISTTINTTGAITGTAIDDFLDNIERMIREAEEAQRERDRELIEVFVEAGFRLYIDDNADRPTVALPPSFRDAWRAVLSERLSRSN